MPSPSSSSMESVQGDFVLLQAGTLRLLCPQSDVKETEHLEAKLSISDVPGVFVAENDPRPYLAISSEMVPLSQPPTDRFIVLTFTGSGDDSFCWFWHAVRVLPQATFSAYRLPEVLLAPYTPVSQYVVLDEEKHELAYLCTAQQLQSYVYSFMM